jgi:ParB family transcriptional regulator, chromosome partitioning protein
MEVKMLDMNDIIRNPKQPRQSFDHEKIMELANSIKESELLQPIVVRKLKYGKHGIVCGERRFRAYEYLKEKQIPAIVREFKDDTDALEKSLIENLQRDDLTPVERENAIAELFKSGHYKSGSELARKLGIDKTIVSNLTAMKEDRERLMVPPSTSTDTLTRTRTLEDNVRKKIIQQVEDEKIPQRNLMDVVRKVKEFPEPEQQMEILEEFEEQEEQSKEIFDGIVEKQRRIAQKEIEPEHFKENNADVIRLETIKDVYSRSSGITSFYIKKIESEKQRNEAIQYIKKTMIHWNTVLVALGELKVIEHAK